MKRLFFVLSIVLGLYLFPSVAYADSPLTTTSFYAAYEDVSIVEQAHKSGVMDQTIAKYLKDSKNPIDVKAAVINALSWDADGKTNAEKYCKLIYKKSVKNMKMSSLSGDQQFCIGYLLAMDNYNKTTTAVKYLKAAEKKIKDSFTVSIIRALVESMDLSDDIWEKNILPLWQNSDLKMDMRQAAADIIIDYMACYNTSSELVVSDNNLVIANGDSSMINLYGGHVDFLNQPFFINKGSNKASAAILGDENYLMHLKLTGLVNGESSVTIKDSDSKAVKINFDVVSEAAAAKLKASTAMYVGSTKAYAGMKIETLTKDMVPFLKDGEPFVPVEFVCSTIGVSVAKLNAAVETRKGIDFVSLKDIAEQTDKSYVYAEGLILLFDKSVNYDKIADDYIISELSGLLNKGKPVSNYPIVTSQNGLYGYKDSSGKMVIKPKYSWAGAFVDGIAAVCMQINSEEKKYGFIDVNGNYILNLEYDWAYTLGNGLAPVKKDGKFFYINSTGVTTLTVSHDGAGGFSSGLAPVYDEAEDKWGYIDITGKLVIPCKFTDCDVFDEGYAAVKVNDKWGFIDRTGNIIIEPEYDDAYSLDDGIATVVLDGVENTINIKGDFVIFYDNGDIYVGSANADGYLDGYGIYTYADGSQYTGEFVKGYEEGKGILTSPLGYLLDGDFKESTYIFEEE